MKLNKEQKEAVLATEGPSLVLAGAGSGKTMVITERIKHLIEDKSVLPERILSITFTNKAAKEMKDRVIELIGERGRMTEISTFHSFALSILKRRTSDLTNVSGGFKVYTPDDIVTLIKSSIEELGYQHTQARKEGFVSYREAMKFISTLKNDLFRFEDLDMMNSSYDFHDWEKLEAYLDTLSEDDLLVYSKIYNLYEQKMKRNNALDFDDLLLELVFLLEDRPDILSTYQDFYQYINIDEYQDTNVAQYVLANRLAAKHKNITVVGDDYQSIYKFRGSDITNILNFREDYPEAKEVRLEQNYRSTKNIIESANTLIKNNSDQMHKELFTDNPTGDRVRIQSVETVYDEADFVVNYINHLLGQGYKESDFAILYRSASKTYAFESKLTEAGLPYQMSGSRSFFERREIQDIVYYLRYFLDPNDPVFFERISDVPRRGVSTITVNKIIEEARSEGKTILDVLKDPSNLKRVNKRAREGIEELRYITEFYTKMAKEKTVSELVVDLVTQLDLVNTVYGSEEADTRKRREEALEQLMSIAASSANNGVSLEEFVDDLTLDPIDAEQENKVQMMTIHASKGLEFPVVFIVNMNEGNFPSSFIDMSDQEELEEERRVAYVALTRAEEKLFLTYSETDLRRRGRTFQRKQLEPSMFLYELPQQNIIIN